MVMVVSGGVSEFDAFAYQEQHPSTIQFLANQFHTVTEQVTSAGRKFLASAKQVFEDSLGDFALRKARALRESAKYTYQRPSIVSMWDLPDFQQANHSMQRWIMANPTVRQMAYDQRIDGYSDTYVDMHPGSIGEDHVDYRMVMNGMVQDTVNEDGESDGFKITMYFDDLQEGDRPLDIREQVDIIDSWAALKAHIQIGESDPTSPFDGSIG